MIRRLIDAIVYGTILAILSRLPKAPDRAKVRRRMWIDRLLEGGVLFGSLALAGLLAVVFGLIPIKASSGHWGITRWFLEFSMERAFTTQSLTVEVPESVLDDPRLILRGAGQYETACRPCHGSPELRHPRVAAAMTPAPPYLPEEVSNWDAAELFSIVKHGVKFTGMPAWPAQHRDDEVWAMVAFLQRFPRMRADEYQQLVFGNTRPAAAAAPIEMLSGPENLPRVMLERCARCHGVDGRGRGAFPKLAGQHEPYLFNTMRAFAAGERHSGIMEPVAAGLTLAEMRRVARYYANLPPAVGTHGHGGGESNGGEDATGGGGHTHAGGGDHAHGDSGTPAASNRASQPRPAQTSPRSHPDSAAIARGRVIAEQGIPSQKVPPCVDCHGPTTPHPRDEYPMLAGQYAEYMFLQLQLFAAAHRGGTPYAHLMNEVAPRLEPEQMREVAAYYESLVDAGPPRN